MAYFHLKFGMDMSYNQLTNPAIFNFTVGNRQKLEIFKKKFIFALSSQNGTKKTWRHRDLRYDPKIDPYRTPLVIQCYTYTYNVTDEHDEHDEEENYISKTCLDE